MHVGSGEVVVDEIDEDGAIDVSHRAALEVLSSAQTEVLIENAYFVPGEAGFDVHGGFRSDGAFDFAC